MTLHSRAGHDRTMHDSTKEAHAVPSAVQAAVEEAHANAGEPGANRDPRSKHNPATFQRYSTPDAAWGAMLRGNARFIRDESDHPRRDHRRRRLLEAGQRPHVAVLACSDSRVPVEIIFDQGLGDAFVIRTAGEITDLSVLASMEFAADALGVPLIIVLGHESCGAVAAAQNALDNNVLPDGFQRVLVEKVTPSLLSARAEGLESIHDFERNHVREIVHHLVDRSPEIQQRIRDGRLAVAGMRYRLSDGLAEPLISVGLSDEISQEWVNGKIQQPDRSDSDD